MSDGERVWHPWQTAYVAADPLGRVTIELRHLPLGFILERDEARVLAAQLTIEAAAAASRGQEART